VALVCQLLSSLSSAASKYLTAVSSCHSLHEAMFLFTVKLFRLICSFQLEPSLIRLTNVEPDLFWINDVFAKLHTLLSYVIFWCDITPRF